MRAIVVGLMATAMMTTGCLVEIKDLATGNGGAGGVGGPTSTGGMGTGGAGTGGGSGGTSPGTACPDDMVHATHPDYPMVSFCIDETETTRSDYVAFLVDVGDNVANTEQPMECAFNTELVRTDAGSNCPDGNTGGEEAMNCVDWCDAYAYCAWAGKRLCGDFEGGTLDLNAGLANDEWHFACTGGLQKDYPYGDTGQPCACYIPEEWEATMCSTEFDSNYNLKKPVATHPGCEGGFDGIFDMQGNVAEWTARCEPGGTGMGDELCMTRGGHTWSAGGSSWYSCDNLAVSFARSARALEAGIRCCKDAN